jgi:hypothetical protein
LEEYAEEWRRRFGVASGELGKNRIALRSCGAEERRGKKQETNERPQGGVGCVASKGLTNSDFGSVASKGLTDKFFGSVANNGLRGVFGRGRGLLGRDEKYHTADEHHYANLTRR